MIYENTDPGMASMKRARPGTYLAILIGVADCGTQPSQFGNRPQVMLRWELHEDNGSPFLDDKEKVYTATQIYSATIKSDLDGKPSTFARVLNAHGVNTDLGARVDSRKWPGLTAILTIETASDPQYTNVTKVDPIPDDNYLTGIDKDLFKPVLPFEHWEPEHRQETRGKNPPPIWAEWKIGMSSNLWHLAQEKFQKYQQPQEQPPPEYGQRPTQGQGTYRHGTHMTGYQTRPNPGSSYTPPPGGMPTPSNEDDIPFFHSYPDSDDMTSL